MEKEYIIIKTMTKFAISYCVAKMIVDDLEKREELEGYKKHIDQFPTYSDLREFYYGGN